MPGSFLTGQKFILFSGKGGVGKTTCAAATALHAADRGKKTLLFSTDPAHSLADSLGSSLPKGVIGPVAGVKNLWAVEIDAEQQLTEVKSQYGAEFVEFLVAATYLDRGDVEDSLDLDVPGIDELMGLKAVMDFMDSSEFELFIWDTAPTGHTLRLLALPETFDRWIKLLARLRWKYKSFISTLSGRRVQDPADDLLFVLKKTVKRVNALLQNQEQSKLVLVSLLEQMVLAETKRLASSLRGRKIPVRSLVLNRVMGLPKECPFCCQVYEGQQKIMQEALRTFAGWDIRRVPMDPGGIKGTEGLRRAAESMFGG